MDLLRSIRSSWGSDIGAYIYIYICRLPETATTAHMILQPLPYTTPLRGRKQNNKNTGPIGLAPLAKPAALPALPLLVRMSRGEIPITIASLIDSANIEVEMITTVLLIYL